MTAPAGMVAPAPLITGGSRLLGVDVARSVAQLGMLIAHYTFLDGTGGDLRGVHRFVGGKAMPLFVFLGGVGFTMLTRRAAHPAAQALSRGAVLFAIGLILVEHAPLIAVILQFYGVFFALGLVVRRLSSRWLLVLAAAVTIAGGLSWLYVAPGRVRYGGWQGWETVTDLRPLAIDLFVTGSYPVLPTFAFFLVGMVVGRLALGRRTVQVRLLAAGLALGLLGLAGGEIVSRATTDQSARAVAVAADPVVTSRVEQAVERRGESTRDAVRAPLREQERAGRDAPLWRLADPVGHGKMPAWVIGATGWSLAVLGGCLLATQAWPRLLHPLAMAGQLALTFYVLQAVGLRWWYTHGWANSYAYTGQLVACLVLFGGFVVLATLWRRIFDRGPLEALLRGVGLVADAGADRVVPNPIPAWRGPVGPRNR